MKFKAYFYTCKLCIIYKYKFSYYDFKKTMKKKLKNV